MGRSWAAMRKIATSFACAEGSRLAGLGIGLGVEGSRLTGLGLGIGLKWSRLVGLSLGLGLGLGL